MDGSDPSLWYRLAACAAAPTNHGEARQPPESGTVPAIAEAGATTSGRRRQRVGGPGSRLRLARFALERALLVQPQHLPSLILCPQVLEALGDHGPSLREAKQRLAARDPYGTLSHARPNRAVGSVGASGGMPAAAVDLTSASCGSSNDSHVTKLLLRDATWVGLGDLLLRAVNSSNTSIDGGQCDDALPTGLLLGWPCVVVELAEAPASDPLNEMRPKITQPREEDASMAERANLTIEGDSINVDGLSRNSSSGRGESDVSFTDAAQINTTRSKAQEAEAVAKDASRDADENDNDRNGASLPQGEAALDVDKQNEEGPSSARRSRRQVERKADELKRVEEDTKRRHDTLKDDVLAPILATLGAGSALLATNVAPLAGKLAGDSPSCEVRAEDSTWWLWPEYLVASIKERKADSVSSSNATKTAKEDGVKTIASARGKRGSNRKKEATPAKDSSSESDFQEAVLRAIITWHTKRKVNPAGVTFHEHRTVHAFLKRQPAQPLAQWLQVFVSNIGHQTAHLTNKLKTDIALALSERQHLSSVNDISGIAGSELSNDIIEMSAIACAAAGWSDAVTPEASSSENAAAPAPLQRLSSTFLCCVDIVRAFSPAPIVAHSSGLSGGLDSVQAELLAAELALQKLAYDLSVAGSGGEKHHHDHGDLSNLSSGNHGGIDSDSLTSSELWARMHHRKQPYPNFYPNAHNDDKSNLASFRLAAEKTLWEVDACIARLKLQCEGPTSSLETHQRYANSNASLKTRLALVKASRAFLGHAATLATSTSSSGKGTGASRGGRYSHSNSGSTATMEESQYLTEASAALGTMTCLWRPHLHFPAIGVTAYTVDTNTKQNTVRNEAPNTTGSRWANEKETIGGVITTPQSLEARRKELAEVDRLPSLRVALTNALFDVLSSGLPRDTNDNNDEGSRDGNSNGGYSDYDGDNVDVDSIDEFSDEESSSGSEASSSRLSSLGSCSHFSNLHAHSAGRDSSHARLLQLENSPVARRRCAEALEATLLVAAKPRHDGDGEETPSQNQEHTIGATIPSLQQQQPALVADALEDLMQHCPQLFPALPQGAAGGSDTSAANASGGNNGSASKPRPGRPPASSNRLMHGLSGHTTLGPPPLAALAALSAERTRRHALGLPLAPPVPSFTQPVSEGDSAPSPATNHVSAAHRASLLGASSSSAGRSAVDGRCLDEDDDGRRLLRLTGARKASEKWCEAQANAAAPTSVIGCWLHAATGHNPNLTHLISSNTASSADGSSKSSTNDKTPTAAGLLTFLTAALEHAVCRASATNNSGASPPQHEHLAIIEGLLRTIAAALWRCSHAHESQPGSSNSQPPTVGTSQTATTTEGGDHAQLHPACASWGGAAATIALPQATTHALAAALLACMKLAAATATQDARDALSSSNSSSGSSGSGSLGSAFGVGAARRTVAGAVLEACLAVAYSAPVAYNFEPSHDLRSRINGSSSNENIKSAQPIGWYLLRAVGRGCLAFACACLQQSDLLSSRHSGVLLLAGPAATALKHAPALANPTTCCVEATTLNNNAVTETSSGAADSGSSGVSEMRRSPTPLLAQLADGLAQVLALAAHHDDSNAPRPALPVVLALRVPAATALVWLLAPPPPPPSLLSQEASSANAQNHNSAAASPLYALFPGFLAPLPLTNAEIELPSSSPPGQPIGSCGLSPAARLAVCESLHEFLVADVGLGDPDLSPPLKAAGLGGGGGSSASSALGGSSAGASGGNDADASVCPESDAEPL